MLNKYRLLIHMEAGNFTRKDLAEELGITYVALGNKINGQSEFKCSEVSKLGKLMNMTEHEVFITFIN